MNSGLLTLAHGDPGHLSGWMHTIALAKVKKMDQTPVIKVRKLHAGKRVLMLLENNTFMVDVRPKQEARTLLSAGYRVSVICPRPPRAKNLDEFEGVRLYMYPAPPEPRGFIGYAWEYMYATLAIYVLSMVVLMRSGFDILHLHNPPDTFFLLGGLCRILGKRIVYDHHDLAPEIYQARYGTKAMNWVVRVLILFERLTCLTAHRILATNESYKVMEVQRGHVPPGQITIVRNGPDLRRQYSRRSDFGSLQNGRTTLGYVGRIGLQDGVDHLIRAVQCLLRQLGKDDFLCVIVGDGDALAHVKSLAKELQVEQNIWFIGWLNPADVPKALDGMDICVAPEPSNSLNDRSTMIKVIEYMASGKPIVAFDLPEHRFSAQSAASYARPNDDLDLARHIALLMDDPDRRASMGRFGRKRVESRLAWEHQEKHLLEAYEALWATKLPAQGTRD